MSTILTPAQGEQNEMLILDTPPKRLKYFLSSQKISFRKMASIMDMPLSSTYQYCCKRTMGDKYCDKLALLGLNIEWYMTGRGNMQIDPQAEKIHVYTGEAPVLDTPPKRLKYFLQSQGISCVKLSSVIGMPLTATYQYRLTKTIGAKYRDKLSLLGLNVGWYLTGEGNMLTKKKANLIVPVNKNDDFILDTPPKRLKYFLQSQNITCVTLASVIGMPLHNIYQYKSIMTMGAKYRNKLSLLGLSVAWYLTGEGNMLISKNTEAQTQETQAQETQPPNTYSSVDTNSMFSELGTFKVYDIPASACLGAAVNYNDLPCGFKQFCINPSINPENTEVFKILGESMSDCHIHTGDYVFVNTKAIINKDKCPVLAIHNDCLILKEYHIFEDSFKLYSRNSGLLKEYPINNDDSLQIIGIVVAHLSIL